MSYQINPGIANLPNSCSAAFRELADKIVVGLGVAPEELSEVSHLAGSYGRSIGQKLALKISKNPDWQQAIINKNGLDEEKLPKPGSELHTQAFDEVVGFVKRLYPDFKRREDLTLDTPIPPYFQDGSRLFIDLDRNIHEDVPSGDLEQLTTVAKLTNYLLARRALSLSI